MVTESKSVAAEDETSRLRAVRATGLLDMEHDIEFDQLVQLAAGICGTPMSMFSLVDEDFQWLKAATGVDRGPSSRKTSFCTHVIQQPTMFVVEDARLDRRFATNPYVTGDPNIRFYAGMPVTGPEGLIVGTLCVADVVPRQLTPLQRTALEILAVQVQSRLQLLQNQRQLVQVIRQKDNLLRDLQSSEDRFRTFMNNAPVPCYIKDPDGAFVFYNQRLADCFNVDQSAWLGKTMTELRPGPQSEQLRANDLEAMEKATLVEHMEETINDDGKITSWRSYRFPCWNDKGFMMLGGFSVDVTEHLAQQKALEESNSDLAVWATVDELTSLPNRRVLDMQLDYQFAVARSEGAQFSVMMVDIDNFKLRNDHFGHAAGDRLLQQLSQLIQATMRDSDVGGRYGGEEFVILMPDADADDALLYGKRLLNAMHQATWMHGPATASIGVATMSESTEDAKQLLALADKAMYIAKRCGKNKVVAHQQLVAAD